MCLALLFEQWGAPSVGKAYRKIIKSCFRVVFGLSGLFWAAFMCGSLCMVWDVVSRLSQSPYDNSF